jgi:capsular exopolysaccharide synthesis family protein
VSRRDAKVRIYGVLYEQYQGIISSQADPLPLQIVQKASPQAIVQEGFQPPRSRTGRMFFAGVLGLLAGIGLVLLLERIDTKIRNRRAAEQHFSLPVLGEIPRLSWRESRRASITAVEEPGSPWADAFRLLEAGLSRVASDENGGRSVRDAAPAVVPVKNASENGKNGGAITILVTSPGPSEGKTMVVANLAATYAEMGKKVLVLSCDFRRPTIHRLFGVPNDQGLTEALRSSNGQPVLRGHIRPTSLDNVRVVPSGAVPEKAVELLSSNNMRQALEEARNEADVVLVDTPPILATSDASHLFSEVDAVLVVGRVGKTTAEVAERSTELLRRLGAPIVGIALNASTEEIIPRGYYYSYQAEGERPNRMGVFPN